MGIPDAIILAIITIGGGFLLEALRRRYNKADKQTVDDALIRTELREDINRLKIEVDARHKEVHLWRERYYEAIQAGHGMERQIRDLLDQIEELTIGPTEEDSVVVADYIVLIIEDNKMSGDMLTYILNRAGIRTLLVRSGKEAIDIIDRRRDISAVLTDIMLPDISPQELYDRISQSFPPPAIVFISGTSREDHDWMPPDAVFLQKPVPSAGIVAAVQNSLIRRKKELRSMEKETIDGMEAEDV